jgi:allantoicase
MAIDRITPAPPSPEAEAFAAGQVNLLDPRLEARAVSCSDDFFASMDRMLSPAAPVFAPDEYDENGKWMDGWESRRRRSGGNDHCIVRLGQPGRPRRVDIDTSFFTGNYPPSASIEACVSDTEIPGEDAGWITILPAVVLAGNSHNLFEIPSFDLEGDDAITHLRLSIYPDGGVARLRVYGEVAFDWSRAGNDTIDLAALLHGTRPVAWNDSHYGPPHPLLSPGRGVNMGDGWETRRRREPGNDWIIVELGHPGIIESALIDTAHFKGNFPESCSLQAAMMPDMGEAALVAASQFWPELMNRRKLSADAEHPFDGLAAIGPVNTVRFNIFPDGGVSRLRLFGKPAK